MCWHFVQWPILITPMFLFVSAVLGSELSLGLLRAARAERDVPDDPPSAPYDTSLRTDPTPRSVPERG